MQSICSRSKVRAGNFTESIIVNVRVWIGELSVVKHIEGIHPDLGTHALGNRGGLGQAHIKIYTSRPAEEVPPRRAVARPRNVRNRHKRSAVEVQISAIGLTSVGVVATPRVPGIQERNLAEPRREIGVGQVAVAGSRRSRIRVCGPGKARIDAEWKPSPPAQDGVEAPSLHQTLGSRSPGAIEWQIPPSAESDPLLNVEVGGGVKHVGVVRRHLRIAVAEPGCVIEAVAISKSKSEVGVAQYPVLAVLFRQGSFQTVEIGEADVFKLRFVAGEGTIGSGIELLRTICGHGRGRVLVDVLVQHPGGVGAVHRAQDEGVHVLQRGQSFRAAAHIVDLCDQVWRKFVLQTQIVLIGIRRVEMRVHEEQSALEPSKRKKIPSRRVERGGTVGWTGWKWVGSSNAPRLAVKGQRRVIGRVARRSTRTRWILAGRQTRIADARFAVERWRAVELQVVFALQHIVENADAATEAGLAAASRAEGKADARPKICLVRKVGTPGSSRVSGKDEAERGIRKSCRLISGNNGKTSTLRVKLGRAVLIAKPET